MTKPLGDSVVVKQPWIEVRGSTETVGVRKIIPTKTVAGEIVRSLASVKRTVEQVAPRCLDRPFFRFHSINMGVTYDIEIGYLRIGELPNAPGLLLGKIPEGTYACLRYRGKNRGYQGNKVLIDWIRTSGYEMDNWDAELGDTFACRYEVYISDIEREPDNKQWLKELAIKLRD
jgi:effector-binding domain-containing protein